MIDLDEINEQMNALTRKREQRAAALAEEGRAEKWVRIVNPTREEAGEQTIRWAFWKLSGPKCKAEEEYTEDLRTVDVLDHVINMARQDERNRIAAVVKAGLRAVFGKFANDLLEGDDE